MIRTDLINQIKQKKSFLCVGLDTDLDKIPKDFLKAKNPVLEYNKEMIDATKDLAVAYKLNLAFYEVLGDKYWETISKTMEYIPSDVLTIADAKRGDIGNTTKKYAETYFKTLNFDAVTVSPYMGEDAITPYLEYEGKWVIVLGLTSNEGSEDFQTLKSGKFKVFEHVLKKAKTWGNKDNMMFVIGATHPDMFTQVRKILPDHFLLVPGVGAQGGDLFRLTDTALNDDAGLLVSASRSILYAGKSKDYKLKAMKSAYQFQREMEMVLTERGITE